MSVTIKNTATLPCDCVNSVNSFSSQIEPVCVNDNNISLRTCQETIENELQCKFIPKKINSELLAQSYLRQGLFNKSIRVNNCGTLLQFAFPLTSESFSSHSVRAETQSNEGVSSPTLYRANFCKDRLCPMCTWRREKKVFSQVSQIMDYLGDEYRYIMLTLTIPNCAADARSLSNAIDELIQGFKVLTLNRKRVKSVVKGFFRSLEITYNSRANTFHPHLHCILAVKPSYFGGRDYISRSEWLSLWQGCLLRKDVTQVDVRAIKDRNTGSTSFIDVKKAVCEVAKYSVKDSDYLFPNDDDKTDFFVGTLSGALYSRRLVSFGGCFKNAWRSLNLDDVEDGDLVVTDGTEIRNDVAKLIVSYGWSVGYSIVDVFTVNE